MKTYKYKGELIYKNEGVGGYALPFSSYVGGRFWYADSLSGIRELVRKAIEANR